MGVEGKPGEKYERGPMEKRQMKDTYISLALMSAPCRQIGS